jgi:hypothetical protein
MAKRFGDRIGLRKTGVFELPDWHMNFMAAARAVLGWPDAFGEFIDQIRGEAQSRSGYFGRTKEVGQLAVDLRIRYGASRKMCDQIETAVEAFFASKGRANTRGSYEAIEASDSWTSFKDALKKHGDPRFLRSIIKHKDIDVLRVAGAKRSPVYFDKFQLELLMQARSRLLGLDRLPLLTGFPQSVLEGLNASNHVRIVDSHVARLRRPQVHPDEVEKLEGRIKASASPRREGQIPVLEALRISGTGNHLVHVIRAILDGEVRFSLLDQKGPVLSKIALLEEEICRVGRKYGEMQIELPDKMTARDAGIFLDVNADDIPGLIGLGCLKSAPPHRGRFVEGQSVQQFSTKLVSHCRAASWLRIDVRSVKSFMKKQGVNPFASYMTGNRTLSCVWRRTDLDALVKSR